MVKEQTAAEAKEALRMAREIQADMDTILHPQVNTVDDINFEPTRGFKHDVWTINYGQDYHILYDDMIRHDIDIVWVMPSSPLSQQISYDDFNSIPPSFSWYSPPENIYDGQPYIIRFRRLHYKHAYPDKYICFPAHMECAIPGGGDRGQWNLPDPLDLSTTLDYIENELGISYIWTNGNVGEQYLRKCHEDIKTHIRPLPKEQIEPFKEVLHGAMDRPTWRKQYQWGTSVKLGINYEDSLKKFIVGYDKNGQYVGASNSAYLGNGGYTFAREFKKDFVGFWQYKITDVSNTPFNGYDLPCPLDVNRQWASTALINAARDVGVKLEIDHGIIWKQQGRYLQKWASNLWQFRINLRDPIKYPNAIARENAERTMKAIPNSMVGRFMNEYSHEYHHPDWQLGIIHQAMTSQVYSLVKLNRDYDIKPVLVNKDAFYFLIDDPGFIPHHLSQYSQELRGFKKIGIAPLSDTIIEAFSEEKSTNKLESLIKKEMKEYDRQ